MTADIAELHLVEGAIYQAACVASADPLEAADLAERALLSPDSKMRAQAIASGFDPTALSLFFAANSYVLPKYSVFVEACLSVCMS